MAFLSFLPVGIPSSGRLVYRPVYPQAVENSIPMPETQGGGPSMPLNWHPNQRMRPNWYNYPEGDEEEIKRSREETAQLLEKIAKLEEKINAIKTVPQNPTGDIAKSLDGLVKVAQGFLMVAQTRTLIMQSKNDDDKEERELLSILKDL